LAARDESVFGQNRKGQLRPAQCARSTGQTLNMTKLELNHVPVIDLVV
jgi:hypothetical protein